MKGVPPCSRSHSQTLVKAAACCCCCTLGGGGWRVDHHGSGTALKPWTAVCEVEAAVPVLAVSARRDIRSGDERTFVNIGKQVRLMTQEPRT